jgi:hypothetical protein
VITRWVIDQTLHGQQGVTTDGDGFRTGTAPPTFRRVYRGVRARWSDRNTRKLADTRLRSLRGVRPAGTVSAAMGEGWKSRGTRA